MRIQLLVGLCTCALLVAADAPYAGKWKMNPAKSNFGETTITFEQLPGGQMKAILDNQTYTFKTDGSDTMTPWGVTVAWTAVDANTWRMVEKNGGKVLSEGTVKLSPDGKSQTVTSRRTKADGGTSDDVMTYTRVSGTRGLAGKWRTKNLTTNSPETLTLTPKGPDGLVIAMGNAGAACDAKFDGRDHAVTGGLFPPGWTCSIAKSGPRAIDLTWKREGKPMYKSTFAASADGKTLSDTGSAVGSTEKYAVVYDRQ